MSKKKASSSKNRSAKSKKRPSTKQGTASAKKKPSTGKKSVSSTKKKAGSKVAGMRRKIKAVATLPATAVLAAAAPSTPAQCIAWRDGDVRQRIRRALSNWSHQPLGNITSATTLGQLSVGTGVPWNEGNQARLVLATNEQDVFDPFQSVMAPPPVLLPSATTVAEWEKVVWQMQTPHTFCFVFGS